MFHFNIDNKKYTFEFYKSTLQDSYLKFSLKESFPHGVAACGGHLLINNGEVVWKDNDYLFGSEVKAYVDKVMKMKVFI